MANTVSNFSFISQNTDGWSDNKAQTLNFVMETHNINFCFLQEHMQLEKNLYKVHNKFENFCAFSIPASKTNSRISKGRPSGGLAILYRKSLEQFVSEIRIPDSKRVQALHFKYKESAYVFINVYLPNDPQCDNFCDNELLQTLNDINFVFNKYDESVNFILSGDMNCDFSRNTRFVDTVQTFMLEHNLVTIWNKFPCNFTYTHHVPNNAGVYSFSTIDHIMVKDDFIDKCIDGCVLHLGENLSKHEILYMKFKLDSSIPSQRQVGSVMNAPNKPRWNQASKEQIDALLHTFNDSLKDIYFPYNALFCRNIYCDENSHRLDLDAYGIAILEALESAVDLHIPHSNAFNNSLPSWHEYIKPLRDDMNFWHSVWVSADKPMNTTLHQIYRNVRHKYHYAIRRSKVLRQKAKNDNFIKAASEGKMNDILKELKKQRKPNSSFSSTVDNITNPQQISNHFATIYEEIYNKHNSDDELDGISHGVHQNMSADDLIWLHRITPRLISKLIGKLKSDKNDENFDFKSNAFKVTSYLISKPLCLLIKGFLVHGHFTDQFLFSSLAPLVKNHRKSKKDSTNYRLIAVSSILLKLVDLLILELFGDAFKVSNLQFGYQSNSSTILCSWTLRECVNYFRNRGSSVYLCMLDLTKAFDTVKLDKLFIKLCKRLPALFVRLILYTYVNQQCYVRWGNYKSDMFTVSNGVRQGAVASPLFFNVYLDELFKLINNANLGCKINKYSYSILGYADDLSLLSLSREGLQQMVNLVRDYCDDHGIKISVNIDPSKSKTNCIIFSSNLNPERIRLYGLSIPYVTRWSHLGTTIQKDERSEFDINRSRGEFIGNIHSLYQELGHIDPQIFLKLVNIYFSSFYGCTLWDFESEHAVKLYATWNTMIRNAYDLPYATHRYILKYLSGRMHLKEEFYSRFKKFCARTENSEKEEITFLYHLQKTDCRSTFGKNFRNVIVENKDISQPYVTDENNSWRLNFIEKLIMMKSGKYIVPGVGDGDVEVLLHGLCCT